MNIIATHPRQRSTRSASAGQSSGTGSRTAVTPSWSKQIKALDEKLDALWNEHRAIRARIRFGEREQIVKRARAEERLERAA